MSSFSNQKTVKGIILSLSRSQANVFIRGILLTGVEFASVQPYLGKN